MIDFFNRVGNTFADWTQALSIVILFNPLRAWDRVPTKPKSTSRPADASRLRVIYKRVKTAAIYFISKNRLNTIPVPAEGERPAKRARHNNYYGSVTQPLFIAHGLMGFAQIAHGNLIARTQVAVAYLQDIKRAVDRYTPNLLRTDYLRARSHRYIKPTVAKRRYDQVEPENIEERRMSCIQAVWPIVSKALEDGYFEIDEIYANIAECTTNENPVRDYLVEHGKPELSDIADTSDPWSEYAMMNNKTPPKPHFATPQRPIATPQPRLSTPESKKIKTTSLEAVSTPRPRSSANNSPFVFGPTSPLFTAGKSPAKSDRVVSIDMHSTANIFSPVAAKESVADVQATTNSSSPIIAEKPLVDTQDTINSSPVAHQPSVEAQTVTTCPPVVAEEPLVDIQSTTKISSPAIDMEPLVDLLSDDEIPPLTLQESLIDLHSVINIVPPVATQDPISKLAQLANDQCGSHAKVVVEEGPNGKLAVRFKLSAEHATLFPIPAKKAYDPSPLHDSTHMSMSPLAFSTPAPAVPSKSLPDDTQDESPGRSYLRDFIKRSRSAPANGSPQQPSASNVSSSLSSISTISSPRSLTATSSPQRRTPLASAGSPKSRTPLGEKSPNSPQKQLQEEKVASPKKRKLEDSENIAPESPVVAIQATTKRVKRCVIATPEETPAPEMRAEESTRPPTRRSSRLRSQSKIEPPTKHDLLTESSLPMKSAQPKKSSRPKKSDLPMKSSSLPTPIKLNNGRTRIRKVGIPDVAQLTRTNTRKNRGDAELPAQVLAKISAALESGLTEEEAAPTPRGATGTGKTVEWKEPLEEKAPRRLRSRAKKA